jgi:hypothetical protein
MREQPVIYQARSDVTPESEAKVLAGAYEFILRCAEERKKGGVCGTAEDAKGVKNGFRATTNSSK